VSEELALLRDLTAAFRRHLEVRGRLGTVGVSRRPTPGHRQAQAGNPTQAPEQMGVAGPAARAAADEGQGSAGIAVLRHEIGDCQRCKLAQHRQHIVLGTGNPSANLMFVGEAPGADEDRQGEPFVGAAGQLLTRMISAMGYDRAEVYICNVIKCRPPQNRNPEPDEIAACQPFLRQQIAAVKPRVIVALGKFAAHYLCGETTPITRLRGNWRSFDGITVMPTYHPAFLLREEARKREAWSDLKQVVAFLANLGLR